MNDHGGHEDSGKDDTALTAEERQALIDDESAQADQDDALNDARAEQQMLEGAVDVDVSVRRMEQERSRDQDEPDDQLDLADPVPPKGI